MVTLVNDQVRKEIFACKFEQEEKTNDLSLLPPCALNLNLHTTRANCIARIYKQANNLMRNLDDPTCHGWDGKKKLTMMMPNLNLRVMIVIMMIVTFS